MMEKIQNSGFFHECKVRSDREKARRSFLGRWNCFRSQEVWVVQVYAFVKTQNIVGFVHFIECKFYIKRERCKRYICIYIYNCKNKQYNINLQIKIYNKSLLK